MGSEMCIRDRIIWLREQGFTRVCSLLPSPHNLHAYDELGMTWTHLPFAPTDDPKVVLKELYARLREWQHAGERVLLHQEELGDRLMGSVAGYLLAIHLIDAGPQAITIVEQITGRQMGPAGRELVALARDL